MVKLKPTKFKLDSFISSSNYITCSVNNTKTLFYINKFDTDGVVYIEAGISTIYEFARIVEGAFIPSSTFKELFKKFKAISFKFNDIAIYVDESNCSAESIVKCYFDKMSE